MTGQPGFKILRLKTDTFQIEKEYSSWLPFALWRDRWGNRYVKKINLQPPSSLCYDFYLNVSHVIGGNCRYPIQFLPFHDKKHLTWWWIGTIVHRSFPVEWRVNINLKSLKQNNIKKKRYAWNYCEQNCAAAAAERQIFRYSPRQQQSTSTFALWPQNFTWLICHLLY